MAKIYYTVEKQDKNKAKTIPKARVASKPQAPKLAKSPQENLSHEAIRQIQQTAGNKVVQRMIQRQTQGNSDVVDDETTQMINSSRGQGSALDDSIAAKAGAAMGQDFSNVTVHTDETSDQLNKNVGAKAFTTGSDIFFSSGAYDPHSKDGQHLIAHELTHVVQQGASTPSMQTKMTVNDPNDSYEVEADKVADQVVSQPDMQRQEQEEELMGKRIQREEMTEEELMGKRIQREEMAEEEDALMGKWIQREEAPIEDEEL